MVLEESAMKFATAAAVALMLASPCCLAANAANPYSNVNPRNDAGNDTGDSQVEALNQSQIDGGPQRPMRRPPAHYRPHLAQSEPQYDTPPEGYPGGAPAYQYERGALGEAHGPPPRYEQEDAYAPRFAPPGYAPPPYAAAPYPPAGYYPPPPPRYYAPPGYYAAPRYYPPGYPPPGY